MPGPQNVGVGVDVAVMTVVAAVDADACAYPPFRQLVSCLLTNRQNDLHGADEASVIQHDRWWIPEPGENKTAGVKFYRGNLGLHRDRT